MDRKPSHHALNELTRYQFTGQFSYMDEPMGIPDRNVLNVISILFDGPRVKWNEYKR